MIFFFFLQLQYSNPRCTTAAQSRTSKLCQKEAPFGPSVGFLQPLPSWRAKNLKTPTRAEWRLEKVVLRAIISACRRNEKAKKLFLKNRILQKLAFYILSYSSSSSSTFVYTRIGYTRRRGSRAFRRRRAKNNQKKGVPPREGGGVVLTRKKNLHVFHEIIQMRLPHKCWKFKKREEYTQVRSAGRIQQQQQQRQQPQLQLLSLAL